MPSFMSIAGALALLLSAAGASAQVVEQKCLTLEAAKGVIAAAAAEAKRNHAGGAIAVVDAGGYLVALERLDDTFAAGAEISTGKARTAALFKRPTSFFEDVINKGRTAMAALPSLPDFTPLQGGVPIMADGQGIGAVGVSGAASAKQDEEIAVLAAAAVEFTTAGDMSAASPAATTMFDHAFDWYRINVTVPQRIGAFDPTGSTLVFEIVVDDYAEVWLDGRLHYPLGQSGGAVIKGYNAPNRVVLGRDVQPGQRFQLAVFGINGPLSNPPANYIWIRSAALQFHAPEPLPGVGEIVRLDPALDAIIPPDARIEKVAEGFTFGEGPVWDPEGSLLFSDPNQNVIYRWSPDQGVSVFRANSGYAGADIGEYGQPGSNGLTFDPEGRLTIDQHGYRRVVRLEKNGVVTVLADGYEGRRLNSPNDLVYRSDGTLYFTDPPFGLPKFFDDPTKELPYSGVFAWRDGALRLVARDLTGPNGVAFSPDERFLYVTNWDTARKVVMRYPVAVDGSLGAGEVFFDMTGAPDQSRPVG